MNSKERAIPAALVRMAAVLAVVLAGVCHRGARGQSPPARGVFDVRDYGAAGDGKTLDTKAIQAAVDACVAGGGGKVYLASGTFMSGTVFLRSNVTLHIESGAVLLGSPRLADYPPILPEHKSYCDTRHDKSIIYAEKAENIAVTGRGVIDGNDRAEDFKFIASKQHLKLRPLAIRAIQCRNVMIKDVTLRNASMWMQHYLACDGVTVDGITVHSRNCRSCNCLTLDGCHNARVANCDFSSVDDCFELKSTSNRSCKNITVTNCTFSSNCNGFKLGTESLGGFQNIAITNCTFQNVRLAAVALEMVDGGRLDGVNVSRLTMKNVGAAVFVRLGNRARHLPGTEKPGVGTLRNVIINDIQATGVGTCVSPHGCVHQTPDDPSDAKWPADGYALENKVGLSISGLPGFPVENVTVDNVRLRFRGGGTLKDAMREIPECPQDYPEFNMFGTLPAYGFYVRHARNVRFDNLDLGFEAEDHRPALVFDDVEDLSVFDLQAQSTPAAHALIWLRQVRGALIHGCRAREPVATFLRVDGDRSSNVTLRGNDLSKAPTVLEQAGDVGSGAVFVGNNRAKGNLK